MHAVATITIEVIIILYSIMATTIACFHAIAKCELSDGFSQNIMPHNCMIIHCYS